MPMNYTSLTASKGTSGAIATWVSYTKLDIPVIVDEAQSLIYSEGRLRTREMLTELIFTMPVWNAYQALPSTFLEPVGDIATTSFNNKIKHKDSNYINNCRNYNETSGTLGANPFTTTNNSLTVSVNLPSHGFTQDSPFYTTGASAFNGVTIAGTFPINGITDANNFTIDITSLGATPNAGGAGGGSAVNYICDQLVYGTPYWFGIWSDTNGNGYLKFDQAFFQTTLCRLQYYQSLPLLSSSNQTNFLTNRYPKLLRIACMASAAEFMKDTEEYEKWLTRLQSAIESTSVENDMQYRGMDLAPEIP